MSAPHAGRPVIIGEVLFDCFDDGREVLGGAPFNVAWHLHAFGQDPLLISRVGTDDYANQIMHAMTAWGMHTHGIQQDTRYPTGRVAITMQGHSHRFEILPEQAYDHIDPRQACAAARAGGITLLYFGSLITRSPDSCAAVEALRTDQIPDFVDVNLRQPWWQREKVLGLLQGVCWAKLNEEELHAMGYAGDTRSAAALLRQQFGFERLIVTRGEAGALLCSSDEVLQGDPVMVENMVDTVGAGDAFSAVSILGLLAGWDSEVTLSRALAFAASQCEVQGAIRQDKEFYRQWLTRWEGKA